MKTLKLEPKLYKEQIDKLEGTFLNETHFDTVITEDTRVLKENGEPLLVFKKNCTMSFQNLDSRGLMLPIHLTIKVTT